ncbi:MAG: hypothetical protein IJX16_04675, partial [Clostridia bacterium]|nr:hypothetical protein [Clostridia bacterium]
MKIARFVIASFLIFSLTFTAVYGNKKIHANKITTQTESYKGVINLWQIDSFEGGVGSRKQFLLKVARGFEKIHKGVLVMVVNMTKEGAEENFKNGTYPDLISYGNGVNVQNVSEITVINSVDGGQVGDKTFATAWCRGGYALITNPNYKQNEKSDITVVSQSEFTCPLVSLAMSNLALENIEVLAPMDAYVKFVSGKVKYLFGTQRDVNRLESRAIEVDVTPMTEFNDLYQYVSICSKDSLKRYYAEEVI